jgi:hypothetical protein
MGNNRKQQAMKKKAKSNNLTSFYENHCFKNEDGTLLFKWGVNFDPDTMSFRVEDKSLWKKGQLCFSVDLNTNEKRCFIFKKFIRLQEAVERVLLFPPFIQTSIDQLDYSLKATCNLFAEVHDAKEGKTFMFPSFNLFKLDDDGDGLKQAQNGYLNWTVILTDSQVKDTGEELFIKTALPNKMFHELFHFAPKGKDIFYLNPWTIDKKDPRYEKFTKLYFNTIFQWVNETWELSNSQGQRFWNEVMRPYLDTDENKRSMFKSWYYKKFGDS